MLTLYLFLVDAGCKSSIPEKNKCSPDSGGDEWVDARESLVDAKSNVRIVGCGCPDEDHIRKHIVGYCGPDEDDIRRLSPVTDTPSSKLLKHIWAVQSSNASYDGPGHIKDVLQVGELYDVVSIKEAGTRHGPIQIWTFKCLKDGTLKKVFSCADLHRFTSTKDGHLDREKRSEMIKNARIRYKGYQKLQREMYSKYEFEFLQKPKTAGVLASDG